MEKRKMMKFGAVGLAALALVGVAGMMLGRKAKADTVPTEERKFRVEVTEVKPTGSDVFLDYTGLVQPAQITQVNFSTIGTVNKIYVKEGDPVKKGQLLATLDPDDARRQQDNMQQLVDQTDSAVLSAQTALDAARRDYEEACVPADPKALADAKQAMDEAQTRRDEQKPKTDEKQAAFDADKALTDRAQKDYDAAKSRLQVFEDALADAEAAVTEAENELAAADTALTDARQEKAAAQQELDALNAADPKDQAAIEAAQARLNAAAAAEAEALTRQQSADAAVENARTAREEAQAALDAAKQKEDLTGLQSELAKAQAKQLQSETALTAARAQLTAAETELAARKATYDTLAKQGAGSQEAKARKIQMDAAASALNVAKSARITARNSLESAQNGVIDCDLKAPSDGFVVKVVGSEGGMALPIAPTVVLGSHRSTVQFGVSQDDVRRIQEGSSAQVTVGENQYEGIITSIGTMPDTTTRTYMVSVDILETDEKFYLGEMAQVRLEAGQRSGAWLPLSCVLNDGEDYVYIAENGRAVRRAVRILDVSDDKLLLDGLDTGSQVITEGMKTVRSGSAVIAG